MLGGGGAGGLGREKGDGRGEKDGREKGEEKGETIHLILNALSPVKVVSGFSSVQFSPSTDWVVGGT